MASGNRTSTSSGGRTALLVASVLVAAGSLVGWGTSSPASGDAGLAESGSTVQVKGGEFFFRLSTKSAAKPGKVTFVFKNVGHVQHDFKINGKRTPLTSPGKTARLVVTFKKKGKYSYLCTVPGHAAAGMKGTFTVR